MLSWVYLYFVTTFFLKELFIIMTASLSRFSVLRIDDDEDLKAAQRAKDKKKAEAQKLLLEKKNKGGKAVSNSEQIVKKKTKAAQEKAEVCLFFIRAHLFNFG